MKRVGVVCGLSVSMLAAGCTANLLNMPVPLARLTLPTTSDQMAEVARVEFEPANGKSPTFVGLRGLRSAVRNAILNSGQFARVRVGRTFEQDIPKSAITYFDVRLKGQEDGQFDWAWTWPAVYPLPLYWPIQAKTGKVKVQLQVSAFRASKRIYSQTFECEKAYDITFYGFFRTSPIEAKSMLCFRDVLGKFSESLGSPDFGKGVVEKAKP